VYYLTNYSGNATFFIFAPHHRKDLPIPRISLSGSGWFMYISVQQLNASISSSARDAIRSETT
jgi:hypothetical protein